MSTQSDYEHYKKIMKKRNNKKYVSFEQFRKARANENRGQNTMADEAGIDILDAALIIGVMSSINDNDENRIESFDEIEQGLKDAGWMPEDVFEPVTSDDTTDWDSSGNDSSSWDSSSSWDD